MLLIAGPSGCMFSKYAISGVVTDWADGQGIGGVTISFSGGATPVVTEADGTWTKSDLKGVVTVTPSLAGHAFTPASKVVTKAGASVNFAAAPILESVYWYSADDAGNMTGSCVPVPPSAALTSEYSVTVEDSAVQTVTPEGYDVLVISDTGASFDIGDFDGKAIVTFDSGISPLFYWLTGDYHKDEYWDFDTADTLNWIQPSAPSEPGAPGDARVYHLLDGVEGFTRRNDLLEAASTDDADDVVIYRIDDGLKSWWWVHVGPHMGDYSESEEAYERISQIICYALDVLNVGSPVLPPAPDYPTSLSAAASRNK